MSAVRLPSFLPDEPEASAADRAKGSLHLRYEDVSQDGHLVLEALPNALGEIWRALDGERRRAFGSERGVLPILSRVVLETGEAPISVRGPHATEAAVQLSHTIAEDGSVDRIILGMWAKVSSVIGRTQGPAPGDAGRPVIAGRIFAEHVFTRPFGPKEDRKVRALVVDGRPFVPEARYAIGDPSAILAPPEGASPLDDELVPDAAPTALGLDHTDSNQHVNSLVYTRLFIEAALRRLDRHGRATALLARAIDIAYRRPCFAGERVRAHVRAYEIGDAFSVVATLADDGEPDARPRAIARMLFAR